MAIVACGKGHFYDDEKYAACPFCSGETGAEFGERTQAFLESENDEKTVGFYDSDLREVKQDDQTVGFFEERLHIDPIVGWLVCTNGPERGRDYRLHSGRNFVGRALDMDISIVDDPGISRENHCSVIYDPKHGEFLLASGMGTNTYYRGKAVTDPVTLSDGDDIGIGASGFIFIAYCKGERNWLEER